MPSIEREAEVLYSCDRHLLGIGEKISYFPCITQSLARKYLIVPVPGENKYEITGTGKRVGEIYIEMIEDGEKGAVG